MFRMVALLLVSASATFAVSSVAMGATRCPKNLTCANGQDCPTDLCGGGTCECEDDQGNCVCMAKVVCNPEDLEIC